jgi:DUF4097 and DUF4098 domain-containing protein YvlB
MLRWWMLSMAFVGLMATGCTTPLFRATEPVNLTLPWQDYQQIEVQVPNGSVELFVADQDNIQIAGERVVRGSSPEAAQENLKKFGLYAGTNVKQPDTLLVEVRIPQELSNHSAQANLEVALPQGAAASVVAGNGSVRIKGMQRRITVQASNGGIDVHDVVGEVDVEAGNGAVTISGALGNVRAVTGNGRIDAVNVAGNCDLRAGNGAVFADVKPSAGGEVSVRTGNGSIEVVLPARMGLELELAAANGSVQTHLVHQAGDMAQQRRWPRGVQVVESIQGGGCKVDLKAGNGSVTVRTRP